MRYSRLGFVFGLSLFVAIRSQDLAVTQRHGGIGAPDISSTQGYRVLGKVVDDQKQPVIVMVRIKPKLEKGSDLGRVNSTISTQSFANGTFRFENVMPGVYVISVSDPRYLLKDVHVDLREPEDLGREVAFVLERNDGTVHGAAPVPADLAGTTPAAFEEFAKGIQDVRLGGKQTAAVVAANGKTDDTAEAHFKKAASLDTISMKPSFN